jgi:hypothetical protein
MQENALRAADLVGLQLMRRDGGLHTELGLSGLVWLGMEEVHGGV